jgi:two-component system chemotaxis sensor kinase CheA
VSEVAVAWARRAATTDLGEGLTDALLAAVSGTAIVVSPEGNVIDVRAGDRAVVQLGDAVGRPLHLVLGLDDAAPEAGQFQLWLACAIGADIDLWEMHRPDAPTHLAARPGWPALDLDYGPLLAGDTVTYALVLLRPAAAVGSSDTTLPAVAAAVRPAPVPVQDAALVERFCSDARTLLDDCDADLERLSSDREARSAVHRMFRAVHTIKGSANSVGLVEVGALAHLTEDRLDDLRTERHAPTDGQLGILRENLSRLRAAVALSGSRHGSNDAMSVLYGECRPLFQRIETALGAWTARPRERGPADELERLTRAVAESVQRVRFADFEVRVSELRRLIDDGRASARPPRGLLAEIERALDDVTQSLKLYHDVHLEIRSCDDGGGTLAALTTLAVGAAGDPDARARLVREARQNGILSLASALDAGGDAIPRALGAVRDLPAMLAPAPSKTRTADKDAQREIDRAVTSVTRIIASSPELAARLAPELDKLRSAVAALAWVPLDDLANQLQTSATQIAGAMGKQVRVEVDARGVRVPEETRRAVADILGHAIRNAIDHGIEAPADRITRGKPAMGTISVRFQLDQRRVRVEIADDGRGIDLERVRRKAVEAGLISEIAAERAEPAELMELLFEPGFSTAGQVSAVSGRGVGMDVIRALAEERGGFASLTSQPGRGTTVVARLQLGEGRARAASTRVPVFR